MHSQSKNSKSRILASLLLALATFLGTLGAASISESLQSEESNVKVTELLELEIDGEEKLIENRDRRIKRRSITRRRHDTGQIEKRNKSDVARHTLPPLHARHNGCGSHLRI